MRCICLRCHSIFIWHAHGHFRCISHSSTTTTATTITTTPTSPNPKDHVISHLSLKSPKHSFLRGLVTQKKKIAGHLTKRSRYKKCRTRSRGISPWPRRRPNVPANGHGSPPRSAGTKKRTFCDRSSMSPSAKTV